MDTNLVWAGFTVLLIGSLALLQVTLTRAISTVTNLNCAAATEASTLVIIGIVAGVAAGIALAPQNKE